MKRLVSKSTAQRRNFSIEPLETRVLPSGVNPLPIPVSKASFTDADGDKVQVKMKGGDKFIIQLQGSATDNADIDSITIVQGKLGVYDPTAILTVKVKPGKFSDGFTGIGSVTMDDGAGTETLRGLVFNNAVVGNIDLPGNLVLLTANSTDFTDVTVAGTLGGIIVGNHNLTGSISANAIGAITNIGSSGAGDISGNVTSATNITKILTNSITGSVVAGGRIDTLITVEDVNGTVEANSGTLVAVIGQNIGGSIIVHNGNINLGSLGVSRVGGDVTGTVQADGTLAINAKGDFAATASISSGGDMIAKANAILGDLTSTDGAVQFAMKTGGLAGIVTAHGDVTGDGTADAIVIRNGDLSGQIRSVTGDVAAITMTPDTGVGVTGSILADVGNIGAITLLKKSGDNIITSYFINGATIQAGGNIGDITIAHTGTDGGVSSAIFNSSISADGNVGAITVVQTGGESAVDQSSISAGGNIGDIDLTTTGTGSAIKGVALLPTVSAGGTIGAVEASSVSGDAVSTARFVADAGITSISASSTSGDGFSGSSFSVSDGSIGSIEGSSVSGRGIDSTTFQAGANVGAVTATSETQEGINASNFVAGSTMGAVRGFSTDLASTADAIAGSVFTSGSSMGSITGIAVLGSGITGSKFSAGGDIASILGSTGNTTASVDKDGIHNSVFRSHGSIGRIAAGTAITDGVTAQSVSSQAIEGSLFSAFEDILAASGNSIIAAGDIQTSTFLAGYDVGPNAVLDGLAGAGSDDIKGNIATPVQLGNVSVTSDIIASFFASGVGTDNAIIGDGVVGALDDFLLATSSSIGDVTVGGAIAGVGGFITNPRAAFESDIIGVIEADAIGMSATVATGPSSVASIGISAEFFKGGGGSGINGTIDGIIAHTNTRDQAIGDGMLVTSSNTLGFITATNTSATAVSAIGTGSYGANFIINFSIGDITASTPNSPGAVPIDGRGTLTGSSTTFFGYGLIGNVSATAAFLPTAVAIDNAFFGSGSDIGTITTIGSITDGTDFDASGNIASITGGTGIVVAGNILDSFFDSGASLAGSGGITVNLLAGEEGFIRNSSFFAFGNDATTGLGIGNILVQGKDTDGVAILNSQFDTNLMAPVTIGSMNLAAGSFEGSELFAGGDIAMSGGIFVYGNTVHKDFAILNSTVSAGNSPVGGSLGSLTMGPTGLAKDTVGTEISGSNFSGTDIAFGMDGLVERAIIIHGNNTGDLLLDRSGGSQATLSIFESTFATAIPLAGGAGSIGDVLIAQSPGDDSGGGIESSSFSAGLVLGDFKVGIHITDALEDVSAISNSSFRALSYSLLGDIEYGHIGDVVAILTGLPSTRDVITNSTFNTGDDKDEVTLLSFGNITATTNGSGAAVSGSTFRADGDMGTITAQSGSSSNDAVVGSIFSAFGSIGTESGNDIGVVGNVVDSKFLAGYDIGNDMTFDGSPLPGDSEFALPGTERVVASGATIHINRVSVNGNFVASDLIVAIDPSDDIFGNTQPVTLDADGNPLPAAPGDDRVAAEDSFLGTVQVQGGVFTQGTDAKLHGIEAGFIAAFQQPSNVTLNDQLPGFLNNPAGSGGPADPDDVRITGSPSGVPVYISSRDFAGREVDFNFDGNTDIIMIDERANQLKIFFGNGTGGFSEPEVFTVGSGPVSAVIGNFNGDQRLDADGNVVLDGSGNPIPVLDIVVLNSLSDTRTGVNGANTIDILFGDAVTGEFSDARHVMQSLGFGSRVLTSITSSDWFDTTLSNSQVGDGFLDLLITNSTNDNARLLKNDGAGVFTSTTVNNPFATGTDPTGASSTPPLSSIAPETSPPGSVDYNIAPGTDINGLNGPDLVVANSGDGTITIFLGNTLGTGTGQFLASTTLGVGTTPLQTILSDVDDDGDLDILVANFGSDDVTVYFGDGLGGFAISTTVALAAGAQPHSIIVGDFDHNGFIDFATANSGTSNVSVVLNDDGVFGGATTVTNVTINGSPLYITTADYDNDGSLDLAITNADNAQAPVILTNDGTGTFTAP